jgi:hypothetical protein
MLHEPFRHFQLLNLSNAVLVLQLTQCQKKGLLDPPAADMLHKTF